MKKNIIWFVIFAVVITVCLMLWFNLSENGNGTIAVIMLDGKEYKKIDLSKVKDPYDITISTEHGTNIVHVENGAISVTEADCPDKICVNQGKITSSGIPIVCMPHKLYISIEGDDIDGF